MEGKKVRLLIVDDEANIHYSFKKILPPTFEILSALNAEDALDTMLEKKPDVVLMDVKLPGLDGLQALKKMREIDGQVPIVIMTAFGDMNTAIKAMKYGAYEYLIKPFKADKIRNVIKKAAEASSTRSGSYELATIQVNNNVTNDMIVGSSEAMQQVYKMVGQVAAQDVITLIRGESGTGKELVARAILHHSKRKEKPFLEINCAALPETLFESELFGYEKAAFTGATERHIGKFELADGGTMFFDEIGEMSLQTQAKILRVIQTGEFTRVGGNEVVRTNVRLIAATHLNLEEAIKNGTFREDLYYRLNIITINLPPLRERKEDISDLVSCFLSRYNAEMNKNLKGIDQAGLEKLVKYEWPGNVRQLDNCIRRAVVLAKSPIISEHDLDIEFVSSGMVAQTQEENMAALDKILENIVRGGHQTKLLPTLEKILIAKALQESKGNKVRAARLLGINRNTLRNRMKKYAITE